MIKKYLYAVMFALVMIGEAHAGQWIDKAAQAYRGGETVYVGTTEGAAASVDASKIRDAIGKSTVPVFFAVLPTSAEMETTADEMPLAIGRQLAVPVAVGVLVGSKFRANAVGDVGGLSGSAIASSATRAFQDYRSQGPTGVVVGWAGLLPQLPPTYVATREAVKAGTDGTAFPWWMLALIVTVGGAVWYWFYSQDKADEKKYQADMKQYRQPIRKAYKGREYDYTRQQSGNCTHYYNGGYHEGTFYPAGYYSDNFWRDWVIMDTILNRPGRTSDATVDKDTYTGRASHAPEPAPVAAAPVVEAPRSGGGDFSSARASDDFGGGSITPPPPDRHQDFAPTRSETPSYSRRRDDDTPSFSSGGGDFGSSSGGGDWGGGSSGGGDFGGGDSGSSGGGDF